MYRILATYDTIGNDRIYLTDSQTEDICDEVVETLDECVARMHQLSDSGTANSIEIIYPTSPYGNRHVDFFASDHPYAVIGYTLDEIDVWADTLRVSNITPQTHCSVILDDGDELPF